MRGDEEQTMVAMGMFKQVEAGELRVGVLSREVVEHTIMVWKQVNLGG